jgi:hypothetical protein
MDQALLKTLAQFKILMKREKDVQVDLEKLMHDAVYGRKVLTIAEESGNEILVVAALTIRDKFGHFAASETQAEEEKKNAEAAKGKYLHGARS